jgi:hypothetical protein
VTAADLELAKRIAPVVGEEDPTGPGPVPAASSSVKPRISWGKWLVWSVAVVIVGIMARRMLRPAAVTD